MGYLIVSILVYAASERIVSAEIQTQRLTSDNHASFPQRNGKQSFGSSGIVDIAEPIRASVKSSVNLSLKRANALIDVLLDGKETVLHKRRKRSKAAKQHWGHGPWWSKSEKFEHGPWWNSGKSKIEHDGYSSVRRESVEKNPELLRKSLKKLLETRKALSEDESMYSDEVADIGFAASVRGSGRKKVVRKKKRREESKRKKQKTRRVHTTRKSNAAKRRKTRFNLSTTSAKALRTQKRKTRFEHTSFSTSSIEDIRRQKSRTTVRHIPPSAASIRLTTHKSNAHAHMGGTPPTSLEGPRTPKREILVRHNTASTTIAKILKTQKRNAQEKGNITSTISFRRWMQKSITRMENTIPLKILTEIVTAAPSRYNGYQNKKQYSEHVSEVNKNAVDDGLQKHVEGSGKKRLVGNAAQTGKQRPAKILVEKQTLDVGRVKEAVTRKTSHLEKVGGKESTQNSEFASSVLGKTNGDTEASMMLTEKMHSVEEVKKKIEATVKAGPANVILVIVKSRKNAGERFERERIRGEVGQMEGFTKDEAGNKGNVEKFSKNSNVPLKEITTVTSTHGYHTSNQERITRSSDQVLVRHKEGGETGKFEAIWNGSKKKASLPGRTTGNNMNTNSINSHKYVFRNDRTAKSLPIQKGKGENYYASNVPERKPTLNGELDGIESNEEGTSRKYIHEKIKKQRTSTDGVSDRAKGGKKPDDSNVTSEKKQRSKLNSQRFPQENKGDRFKKKKAPASNSDRIRIGGIIETVKINKNKNLRDHQQISTGATPKTSKNVTTEMVADYAKVPNRKDVLEKEKKPSQHSEKVFEKINETGKAGNDKSSTINEWKTTSDVDRLKENNRPKDGKTTARVSDRKSGPSGYRAPTKSEKKNERAESGNNTSSVSKQKPVIRNKSINGRGEEKEPNGRISTEKEKAFLISDGWERRAKGQDTKLSTSSSRGVKENKEPQKGENTKNFNDGKFGVGAGAIVSRKVPDQDTSKGVTGKFANTVKNGKVVNDGNKSSIKHMQQEKGEDLSGNDGESIAGKKGTAKTAIGVKRKLTSVADRLPQLNARDNGQKERDTTSSNDQKFIHSGKAKSQLMTKNDTKGLEQSTSNGAKGEASTDKSANVRIKTFGIEGRSEGSKEVPRSVNETTDEGGKLHGKNNLEKEKKASIDSDRALKRSTDKGRHTKLNVVSFPKVMKNKEPQKKENIEIDSDRNFGFGAGGATMIKKASLDKDASKSATEKSAKNVENIKTISDGNISVGKHTQQMKENGMPDTIGELTAGKDSTAENGQGVKRIADADRLLKENAIDKGQEKKKITTSSNKRKLDYGDGAVPHTTSNIERGPDQKTFAAKQITYSNQFVKDRVRGSGKERESEKKKEMAGSFKPSREMKEDKEAAVLHAERNTDLHGNKSLQKLKEDNELREERTTAIDNARKVNAVGAVIVLQPNRNESVDGKTRGNGFKKNRDIMLGKKKKPISDKASKLKMQNRRKEDSKSVLDKDQKSSKADRSSKEAAKDNVLDGQKNTTSRKHSKFAQVGGTPKTRTKSEERSEQVMPNGSVRKAENDEFARERTGDDKKESSEKENKQATSNDKASKNVKESNSKEKGANKRGNNESHGNKATEDLKEKIKPEKRKNFTDGSERNRLGEGGAVLGVIGEGVREETTHGTFDKLDKKPSNSDNSASDIPGYNQKEKNNEDLNKDKKEKPTSASKEALGRVLIRGRENDKQISVDERSQKPRLVTSRGARKGTDQSKKRDKNDVSDTEIMQSKTLKTGTRNPAEKNKIGKTRINGKGLAIAEKTESVQTTPFKLVVKSNEKESTHKNAIESAVKNSKGKKSNEKRATRKSAIESALINRKRKESNKKDTARKITFKRDRKVIKGRMKESLNKLPKQGAARGSVSKTKNKSSNKSAVFKRGERKTKKRRGKPKIERLKSSFEYEESPWKFRGPMFDD